MNKQLVLDGVEVFRQLSLAVGFDELVWLSRLPVLGLGYELFAKNRLRLTGRADCETGVCAVPAIDA